MHDKSLEYSTASATCLSSTAQRHSNHHVVSPESRCDRDYGGQSDPTVSSSLTPGCDSVVSATNREPDGKLDNPPTERPDVGLQTHSGLSDHSGSNKSVHGVACCGGAEQNFPRSQMIQVTNVDTVNTFIHLFLLIQVFLGDTNDVFRE